MDRSGQGHVVIIGAGIAGVLAAAAAAPTAQRVSVFDRFDVPDGPQPRRGIPQARHAHLLWSGGARAIEHLLPGSLEALRAEGAHQIGLPSDLVSFTAQGWIRRFPATQFLITCSRDLLDWVLRRELLRLHDNIELHSAVEVVGLHGDRTRITGIRLPDSDVPADLVIDASGRSSRAPQWLTELGGSAPTEAEVDSGLAYSTRLFQAPTGAAKRFPLVNVQSDPSDGMPGRTATIVPIENGLWLATLSGTVGGHPPASEEHFITFALNQVRDPIVGQLLANATPIDGVQTSHSGGNRRRYYERIRSWPQGLLVMGDAVASYNPVYGHGMSVIAKSAVDLRRRIDKYGVPELRAGSAQRAICRVGDTPWLVATGQDIQYPGAVGPRPARLSKAVARYFERFIRAATGRPSAAKILYDAFTLSSPMSRLISPSAIIAVIRGPGQPPLQAAPLTDYENDACDMKPTGAQASS